MTERKSKNWYRQQYKLKEKRLRENYEQVAPMDFYRDLFPDGVLQENLFLKAREEYFKRQSQMEHWDVNEWEKIWGDLKADLKKKSSGLGRAMCRYYGNKHTYEQQIKKIESAPVQGVPEEKKKARLKRVYNLDKNYEKYDSKRPPYTGLIMDVEPVHNDLKEIQDVMGLDTAYISPISYYGQRAINKNAHMLFAVVLDIDGVSDCNLNVLINWFVNIPDWRIPPTYIVNSGRGLHFYYLLNEPVPLYKNVRPVITQIKEYIVARMTEKGVSTFFDRQDHQPWYQAYRMPGTMTKLGVGYPATVYRVGKPVDIEQLAKFSGIKDFTLDKYNSKHTLEECKELYPDWYDRKILGKEIERKGVKFPWLYEKLRDEAPLKAEVGNRYFSLGAIFYDASRCNIPFKEVYDYCLNNILPFYNDMAHGVKEDEFTQKDLDAAAGWYNKSGSANNWLTLETINHLCRTDYKPVKRNGKTLEQHLKVLNFMIDSDIVKNCRFGQPEGNKPGRKSKEDIIRKYLQEKPGARKIDLIRDTGLSKPTVYKWYDKIKAELAADNDVKNQT